jgi:hypothetical protein
MVSYVLCGVKNSLKVKKALADLLGYASYDALTAASRRQEGGAA